jgi:hypothetical protein
MHGNATRRHLHRQTEKRRVGFLVGLAKLVEESFRRSTFRSDLGQPYDRFDRF